jgi:allophanate hydrolase subunit 1
MNIHLDVTFGEEAATELQVMAIHDKTDVAQVIRKAVTTEHYIRGLLLEGCKIIVHYPDGRTKKLQIDKYPS